jgi:hypothetical protein
MMDMGTSKYSEEQIIGFLRQAEAGMPIKEIGRNHGFSDASFYRGRIQDTDYAKETANLAKAQIISQASIAMLTQANSSGRSVLGLLT